MKPEPGTWKMHLIAVLSIFVGGFCLFQLAFFLAAIVMNGISTITNTMGQPPYLGLVVYILLILIASYFIFRTKWHVIIKATYLTMPLMIVTIAVAILLYETPWIAYIVDGAIMGGLLIYLIATKKHWYYSVATLYVGVVLLLIQILNIEI